MSFLFFILMSTVIFSGIIVILITILTYVESHIATKADVKIKINDKEPFVTSSGKSLLMTLAEHKIFLPSACGGGGTCAMCTCQVPKGGGDILPTETSQISRKMQKDHYRLACQLKVRQDMDLIIPPEILDIKKFECEVVSNDNVATFIKELVLRLPENQAFGFKAGGYIQIDVPEYKLSYKDFDIATEYRPDWDQFKLWDLKADNDETIFRAYSMANYPGEQGIVKLNVRIATPPPDKMSVSPGKASSYIFSLKPGDKVMVSGPYGEFFIKETEREMIYIGGGAGMAPLRSHLFELFKNHKTNRKVSFWYGARSKREMFYDDEFQVIAEAFSNFNYNVALSSALPEDNWTGATGFIHQAVHDLYLKDHEEPEECEYYLCGPPMMISSVKKMLDSLGVPEEMIAYDEF